MSKSPFPKRFKQRAPSPAKPVFRGMLYQKDFIKPNQKAEILAYLKTLYPIWENRYSEHNPPPNGQTQRQLLRPVYWLGNWQFACLDYYHPPKGIDFRCVEAENFPRVLQQIIEQVQEMASNLFAPKDIPKGWHLNTCLINYYGSKLGDNDKLEDVARLGEHKDFEPGPIASLSFGDNTLFQFVESAHKGAQSKVIIQQWLEDSSLLVFGGDRLKKQLFHRVQRVEKKSSEKFEVNTENFITRRINFTFRYVPNEHIRPLNEFPKELQKDVQPYVEKLAEKSAFFKEISQDIYK